jgi:hypothetical protein
MAEPLMNGVSNPSQHNVILGAWGLPKHFAMAQTWLYVEEWPMQLLLWVSQRKPTSNHNIMLIAEWYLYIAGGMAGRQTNLMSSQALLSRDISLSVQHL